MQTPPFALENPLTGARAVLLDDPKAMDGAGFSLEWTLKPHRGREPVAHLHLHWTERFEIVAGRGRYAVRGAERAIGEGEAFTVPQATPHLHPWSDSDEGLRFRQISVFDPPSRSAIEDTFAAFATLYRLMQEGRTDARGYPRSPLYLALILDALQRHGSYLDVRPLFLQRATTGSLAALGRLRGCRLDRILVELSPS